MSGAPGQFSRRAPWLSNVIKSGQVASNLVSFCFLHRLCYLCFILSCTICSVVLYLMAIALSSRDESRERFFVDRWAIFSFFQRIYFSVSWIYRFDEACINADWWKVVFVVLMCIMIVLAKRVQGMIEDLLALWRPGANYLQWMQADFDSTFFCRHEDMDFSQELGGVLTPLEAVPMQNPMQAYKSTVLHHPSGHMYLFLSR